MEISFLVLSGILGLTTSVSYAALCDPKTVSFSIGKEVSIIDIQAGEIHTLKQRCYKPITLKGAVFTSLNVLKADFGGNRAYVYSDNAGMTTMLIKDKMSIYFGTCRSMTSKGSNIVPVTSGIARNFTTSEICIIFEPELKHLYLGGHEGGGNIQINVTVHLALCDPPKVDKVVYGTCQPLCNSKKTLDNCVGSSDRTTAKLFTASTILPRTTVYTSNTITNGPKLQNSLLTVKMSNIHSTRYSLKPSSHHLPMSNTNTVPSAIFEILPTNKPLSVFTTSTLITKTSPLVLFKETTWRSSEAMVTPYISKTSPVIHSTRGTSNSKEPPVLSTLSTSSMIFTESNSRGITALSDLSTSTVAPGGSDRSNIDVVKVLYPVVIVIILILVLAVVIVCIRKKNTKAVSPSLTYTDYLSQSALHWRDNWLVRYHNNQLAKDSDSQTADSQVSCFLGNFAHEDSTHLHVDQYLDTEIMKNDGEENLYDNPWPLVMLDSDFVRNNKRLERERSNECAKIAVDLQNVDEYDREELIDKSNMGKTVENDNRKDHVIATNGSMQKHGSSMSHYLKHIGSGSRGKYNIAKEERRNSIKSQKNTGCIDSRSIHNGKSKVVCPLDETVSSNRERHPSSICSDCSQMCKDILRDEIQDIEHTMEECENHDDVFKHCEEGKNKDKKSTNSKWRVSTLYAIVSSKNGSVPNGVTLSRTPSHAQSKNKRNKANSFKTSETTKMQLVTSELKHALKFKDGYLKQNPGISEFPLSYLNTETKLPEGQIGQEENKETIDDAFESIHISDGAELGNFSNNSSIKKQLDEAGAKRSAFLSTRELFEHNGSIKQDSKSHRSTGTGQFPK